MPRTSLCCRSGRSLPVKKHWTVSKYADLIPLLAFALVMIGVFFVDRERAGRLEQGQADVAQRAEAHAALLGNELENAINERFGALTAAELQLTSVEDSVSQQTLIAALDSVTGRMTGLVGIAIIGVDSEERPVRASGTMVGSPFGNVLRDTSLYNPYLRARATRRMTASSVIDFPAGRRVVVFNPVLRNDTSPVRNVIAGELDPVSIARVAAGVIADSLQDVFWSMSGPNDIRLTSSAAPAGWPVASKQVRVADTFWRVDMAYRPPETRLVRAERLAVWIAGTALALAIASILFFLRRTINLQREELVRRMAAEEAARTAAAEARQRAKEARDLAAQLEAAQRAAQQLSTSLDPDTVIEFLLGGVAEILSADVASLYTFEDEGEVLVGRRRMVFREVPGITDRLLAEDIGQVRAPVNMMPPHIVEAASTGEPYVNEGRGSERPLLRVTGGAEAPVASVTVPLLIAGRAVGVASWDVFSEAREFPPALVAFAQALAAPAAAALRTAELFASLGDERERAQREALRFAALIDQMADGVVVVDAAGRLDRTNAAAAELLGSELTDAPLDQWPGRFGLVSADGRQMHASELPLTRALRGERVRRASFIVRSPWGSERHLSISAGPIVTPDGQSAGAAMVMRDISDEHQYAEMLRHTNRELRRQAEMLEEVNQQLRQATKAKDQFLAVMSHELRTPINAIMGYSDLLDLGVKGDLNDDQRAMLARVRETSRHLLGLINEVLDLAKIGAGRMDMVLVETDLGEIVTRASEQVAPLAAAKALALEVEEPPRPITVKADETRLTQIVINLLSNAVKFTPSGSVRLSLRQVGDTAEIRVRDSGPGIPDEERERIFEEFYQVEGGFSRSTGGTGLGLAIARRFARLMGGEIQVTSELGAGSEFIVRLPAAHARPVQATDGLPGAVVLLHDDIAIRRLQQDLSGRLRVAGATEPTALAALARREDPELIAIDALAPDHGAWRAIAALQTEQSTDEVPVQLFARDDEAAETALDLGYYCVVTKAASLDRVVHRILHCVDGTPDARVMIVDDDAEARGILTDALTAAGCEVQSVRSGVELLEEGARERPDVVVIDPLNAGGDVIGSIARMRLDPENTGTPVVLMLPFEMMPADMDRLAAAVEHVARIRRGRVHATAELLRTAAGVPLSESTATHDGERRESG